MAQRSSLVEARKRRASTVASVFSTQPATLALVAQANEKFTATTSPQPVVRGKDCSDEHSDGDAYDMRVIDMNGHHSVPIAVSMPQSNLESQILNKFPVSDTTPSLDEDADMFDPLETPVAPVTMKVVFRRQVCTI